MQPSESMDDSDACTKTEVYVGDVCQEALQGLQSCKPESQSGGVIYIPAGRRQDELELQAYQLIHIDLLALQPTQECEVEIVSLLCFQLFKLCDGKGTIQQPCQSIRGQTCASEWEGAHNLTLPNCESLPNYDGNIAGNCYSG